MKRRRVRFIAPGNGTRGLEDLANAAILDAEESGWVLADAKLAAANVGYTLAAICALLIFEEGDTDAAGPES